MSHKHPGLLITLAVMGLFAFSACFLKRPAPATELRRIEPYPSDAPAQIVLTPPLPAPNGGTPAPAPADNSLPTLAVVPVKAYAYPPSHMDIIFSLRDQNGRAEVAPSDMLKVRIFENGQEVDYSETAYFVDQAENLELEVVFVLDFTKSMKDSGAIPLMIEGAKAVVERLGEAHRIAVVEYHDRNQEPAVLQGLTTYKPSLSAAIDEFQEQGYLSGASSGWDAVYKGLSLFTSRAAETKEGKRIIRTLVFLSDGRDTSSTRKPSDIVSLARNEGIQVYVVGTGKVDDGDTLVTTAAATGGAYYRADRVDQIRNRFEEIASDVKGQYVIKYVSLRTSGSYNIAINVSYQGRMGSSSIGQVNLGSLFRRGGDLVGQVTIDKPVVARNRIETFVRLNHVPREVNQLKLKLATSKPYRLELAPRSQGGILENWIVEGPDADGYFWLSSPAPGRFLSFGDSGVIFKATIYNFTESRLAVPLMFDNSIYRYGQKFEVRGNEIVATQELPPTEMPADTPPAVSPAVTAPTGGRTIPIQQAEQIALHFSQFIVSVRGKGKSPGPPGMGVIIDGSSHVLTDFNSTRGHAEVEVKQRDGRVLTGLVAGRDEARNLSLISLPPGAGPRPKIGETAGTTPWEPAVLVARPADSALMYRTVNLSRSTYDLAAKGNMFILQTPVADLKYRGGFLVNSAGELLGTLIGQRFTPASMPAIRELNTALDLFDLPTWLADLKKTPPKKDLPFATSFFDGAFEKFSVEHPATWKFTAVQNGGNISSPDHKSAIIEIRDSIYLQKGVPYVMEIWEQLMADKYPDHRRLQWRTFENPEPKVSPAQESVAVMWQSGTGTYFRTVLYGDRRSRTVIEMYGQVDFPDFPGVRDIFDRIMTSLSVHS